MKKRERYIIAGILVVIPFVVYLAIFTYNRQNPEFAGLPFFYWYQTVWLLISAILFVLAALLIDYKRGVSQ